MEIPKTMRAWRVHAYGQPSEVLVIDEVPVPSPGPGELLVRALGIPLNLNDIDRITGENMLVPPPLPTIPGMEVMGIVDACGDGVADWQGKRVVALAKQAFGGFAQYAICPVTATFEIPEEIALPDAAALYFPFHLAWLGLHDRAGLEAGESVLIHAAAGGSGSAAIQLAKLAGARVFATASTEEKLDLCRDLGADVAINYTDDDFAQVVLDETQGRGVDVVFDNVGEAVLQKSIHCTAYNGRYLMMGFASDKHYADEKLIVPRALSTGNLKLCGVMLAYAPAAIAPVMKRGMGWNFVPDTLGQHIASEIHGLYASKQIRAVVGRVARFEELPGAIESLGNRETLGRTILGMG